MDTNNTLDQTNDTNDINDINDINDTKLFNFTILVSMDAISFFNTLYTKWKDLDRQIVKHGVITSNPCCEFDAHIKNKIDMINRLYPNEETPKIIEKCVFGPLS